MDNTELRARYGASEQGNFAVVDTIGVPHPFTIGPKHVTYASDHCGGMLGEETMRKIPCVHRGCRLSFDEHEKALLVECKADIKDADGKADPELHAYLLKCKPLCEEDKFAGFAFMRATA